MIRVPATTAWFAENAAKQRACEHSRAERRKELGIVDTN
jgi:hypothetical protein